MPIYLQQTSTIEGGGKQAYLESVAETWAPYAEQTRGMRLLFLGSTVGSTAYWPETTEVWELRDWQHYAEVVDRMYTDLTDEPELTTWWHESFRHRKLGQTRVLVGASFSPSLDELLARGTAGTTFGFESFRIAPGKVEKFLDALEHRATLDASRGRTLVGAHEVAFTNDAATAIWVYRGPEESGAYQKALPDDAEIRAWRRSVGDVLLGAYEYWAYSTPATPLWPKDRASGAKVW